MKIHWTGKAAADLERLHAFLARSRQPGWNGHHYRLGHPLAMKVIETRKDGFLDQVEERFG